jgi:L-amino acid N-acyltransferase YncA
MALTDGVVRLSRWDPANGDVAEALDWYGDPDVLYYSEGADASPFSIERVRNMYRILHDTGELYLIEVQENGQWKRIGDVTLAAHTLPIVIGDAAWRSRGVGSRVLRLLIGRARELGWESLTAKSIWDDNLKSRRLFESVGFRLVESAVDATGRPYGRYVLTLGLSSEHQSGRG